MPLAVTLVVKASPAPRVPRVPEASLGRRAIGKVISSNLNHGQDTRALYRCFQMALNCKSHTRGSFRRLVDTSTSDFLVRRRDGTGKVRVRERTTWPSTAPMPKAAATASKPEKAPKPKKAPKPPVDSDDSDDSDDDDANKRHPQPPTRFRCNRARMLLTIRVALHHIGAKQINLKTTPTRIELDTLKARRKFQMSRLYPRGIECDDTRTTARLETGALVVQMPITKLPAAGAAPAASAPAPKPAPAAPKPKRKRDMVTEEPEPLPAPEAAPPPAKKAKKAATSGAKEAPAVSFKAASASSEDVLEDVLAAADRKRQQGVSKMRALEKADEVQKQRAAERQQQRDEQKQKLLETFRKQQAAARAERKASAPSVTKPNTPSSGSPKKRVSWGPPS